MTIEGNGATLERLSGPPDFRLLYVFNGNLTLDNLTITGGEESGAAVGQSPGSQLSGGGIYNWFGTLTLNGVDLTGNSVIGITGTDGTAGGTGATAAASRAAVSIPSSAPRSSTIA